MPETTTPPPATPDDQHPSWCTDHQTAPGEPERCYSDEAHIGNPPVALYAAHEAGESLPGRIWLGHAETAGIWLTPGEAERTSDHLQHLAALIRGTARTATTTATRMSEPCDWYPCDYAYAGRNHTVRNGVVHHRVRSGSDMDAGWSTGMSAAESVDGHGTNDAWQPYLELVNPVEGDVQRYLLGGAEATHRLAYGLLTSARRALEANNR